MNTRRLCHQLAVLAAAALTLCTMPGCSKAADQDAPYDIETLEPGERALVTLPLEFEVPPENRLYLNGERIHFVRLTADPGDSLRLNGVPIIPWRKKPPVPEEHSEEQWLQVYGKVPFVEDLLVGGMSGSEAGRVYEQELRHIRAGLLRAYEEAREEGSDRTDAVEVAFSELRDIDTQNLVDWDTGAEATPTGIDLHWKGLPGLNALYLGDPAERDDSPPTEDEKRLRATMIYERLAVLPGPCWYVIGEGFVATIYGQSNVAEAMEQVETARNTGTVAEGWLPADAVRRILECEGR
ncbi:MAG: hypothetical protein ABIK85_10755 [Candidatus Eisenbacteria bacterium]